jgi:hypothetical protein
VIGAQRCRKTHITHRRALAKRGARCQIGSMAEAPLFSLDGIRMRVVATAASGVVGADTIFSFSQRGLVVTAHYAGGRITAGFLAGRWEADRLVFRYVQVADGESVDSGQSVARVTHSPGGRLRLEESFQWETRTGSGTNVFEEICGSIPPPPSMLANKS